MVVRGRAGSGQGLAMLQAASEGVVLKVDEVRLDLAGCLKLRMSQVSGGVLLQHLQVKQSNEVLSS